MRRVRKISDAGNTCGAGVVRREIFRASKMSRSWQKKDVNLAGRGSKKYSGCFRFLFYNISLTVSPTTLVTFFSALGHITV
jgi:hypothetical protein